MIDNAIYVLLIGEIFPDTNMHSSRQMIERRILTKVNQCE